MFKDFEKPKHRLSVFACLKLKLAHVITHTYQFYFNHRALKNEHYLRNSICVRRPRADDRDTALMKPSCNQTGKSS